MSRRMYGRIRDVAPDVTMSLFSLRSDPGRARDANIGELSVLHFAILYRHVAALQAMVSRQDLPEYSGEGFIQRHGAVSNMSLKFV